MMKYRNVFGRLEYELGEFFIPHEVGGDGLFHVLKHEPGYVTDARFGDFPFVAEAPGFQSWIQAVRFLKRYKEVLI